MTIEKTNSIIGIAMGAMMTIGGAAFADTVHDQSAFDKNAYGCDSVAGSSVQQIADDFRLKQAGEISKIGWTGKYHDSSVPGKKSFEITIFADQKGVPGKVIHVEIVHAASFDTGVTDIGEHKMLSYKALLKQSPTLEAYRTYWLTIRESDPTTKSRWSWSFHKGNIAGGFSYRLGMQQAWSVGNRDMAYALSVSDVK
ncbi:MAG: hypothetical protein GKS01_02855 [Alphaproteobacteria bacterium]|nr:hypothetical protein [Alphaproteobacteria bacterium]